MQLLVTATAARGIREADDWWAENRKASPGLLKSELGRALEMITTFPRAGARATNVELPDVRRVVLPRTRYHLYYLPSEDFVEVVGLWHASRQGPPTF